MSAYRRSLVWVGLGLIVGVLLFAFRPSARALPEYMARTGEPCATCHVNPAGGGPLTARGSQWVAAGKPDKVPPLSGGDQAARPEADGPDLYVKFGCSGCHGSSGEGAAGPALNQGELSADELSRIAREGEGSMPGYQADTLSDADLAALVSYVKTLGRGEASAQAGDELKAEDGPKAEDEPKAEGPARAACGNGAGSDDESLHSCDGN